MAAEESNTLSTLSGSCHSVRQTVCSKPTRLKPPISIHSIGNPAFGTSRASMPLRVPTKIGFMPAAAQFLRYREGRNDVPAGTAACHHELHPACSLTLSSMPSESSVLSSELPP